MTKYLCGCGYAVNRKRVQRLMQKLGLAGMVPGPNTSKPHPPYKLWHTYATRLLEKDVQLVHIQVLLGHESIVATQIYTHVLQERLIKLVADI